MNLVYKIYFDGTKYVVDENPIERPNIFGYSDHAIKYMPDYDVAKYFACSLNSDILNGERKVFKCKDCGEYFEIDSDKLNWYAAKKLNLPTHCYICRNNKK